MAILPTEYVTVTTNGPLEVRGDDFDTALFVAGQPAAYFWSDFEGSIGQNLVRAISMNPPEAVQKFRDSIAALTLVGKSIAGSFPELLSILAAGEYKLEMEEMSSDVDVVEFRVAGDAGIITNFYPGFGALVTTQPQASLCEEIVRDYDYQLADGARPVIVTLTGGTSWADFVIDGHHKLQSYRRYGARIHRLAIIKLDPQPLELLDVLDFIPDEGTEKAKLLANKKRTE